MPFRWLFDEGQRPEACIDQLAYDEWVEFIFEHPAAGRDDERWYNSQGAEAFFYKDSQQFLRRVTLLFSEADLLLSRYTTEQIKQGFWCIISAFELSDLLEDKELSFKDRRNCLLAIDDLYRRLFRRPGFEKIAASYWDPLTYSFSAQGGRAYNEDHAKIQGIMFDVLCGMLSHSARITRLAALRGLGQLRHPRRKQAILDFIEANPGLSPADRAYALARANGELDMGLPLDLTPSSDSPPPAQ